MSAIFNLSTRQINSLRKGKAVNLKTNQLILPDKKQNKEIQIKMKVSDLNRLENAVKTGKGFRITPSMFSENVVAGSGINSDLKKVGRNINKGISKAVNDVDDGFKQLGRNIKSTANDINESMNKAIGRKKAEVKSKINLEIANVEGNINKNVANAKQSAQNALNKLENEASNVQSNINKKVEKGSQEAKDKMAKLREMKVTAPKIEGLGVGKQERVNQRTNRRMRKDFENIGDDFENIGDDIEKAFNKKNMKNVENALKIYAPKVGMTVLKLLADKDLVKGIMEEDYPVVYARMVVHINGAYQDYSGKKSPIDQKTLDQASKVAVAIMGQYNQFASIPNVPVAVAVPVGGSFKTIEGKGKGVFGKVGDVVSGRGFKPIQ